MRKIHGEEALEVPRAWNANNIVVPAAGDAALPSGNPHGSGMSKCAAKLPVCRRMTWNTLVKLASPTVSAFVPQFLGQTEFICVRALLLGRLGLCRSSRELVMTIQRASELSLCNFHFKLLGALTVVPHSTCLDIPLSGGVAQGKCSNAALKRLPTSGT